LRAERPAVRAHILLETGRKAEALDAAAHARRLAPYDAGATATHAHALAVLGLVDEAEHAARDALAIDPEEESAHHALGLVGLTRADSDQALAGFRETLRLDPTDERAPEGLVLALKARQPGYARLLQFFLWQARLPRVAQLALLVAPLVLGRLIRHVHHDPLFVVFATVFIGVIVLTWAADPLMTLVLLATREGRYVVSRESRIAAALFAGFVAVAVAAAIGGAVSDPHLLIVTLASAFFALSAGNVDSLSERRRRIMYAATATFAVLDIVVAAIVAAGGGFNALIVPAAGLFVAAAASLWYVRLAS
jgi:hypothetical protein